MACMLVYSSSDPVLSKEMDEKTADTKLMFNYEQLKAKLKEVERQR